MTDRKVSNFRPRAVESALEIFSDKWSFKVLQELFFGVRRFDEFQRNLGISRSVLTMRLNRLVEENMIWKRQYEERPPRFEYLLTDQGRDIYTIFILLEQWGEKWLDVDDKKRLRLIHTPCRKRLVADVICKKCGGEVNARSVSYKAK